MILFQELGEDLVSLEKMQLEVFLPLLHWNYFQPTTQKATINIHSGIQNSDTQQKIHLFIWKWELERKK